MALLRAAFKVNHTVPTATALLLALCAAPALGDNYLMYGPSLALWLQNHGAIQVADGERSRGSDVSGGLGFLVDESSFALAAGHSVTIVDEAQWRAMGRRRRLLPSRSSPFW